MKKVKTNFGAQILIVSIALLIALPVRVYQYLNVIDKASGFYTNWLNPTVFGLYGVCLFVVVLVLALSTKGSKKTIYSMPDGKLPSIGISSLVLALAFLFESAYNAFRAYGIANGSISIGQLVLGNSAGKSSLAFTALQAVFGIFSAVFFIILSVSFFSGKGQYKKAKVFAVFLTLWAVARLMIDFTQTISYRYVSELLFELLMIVFFSLFAVSFAKFLVGALNSRIQMRIFGYGALAVFFGLLNAVPRYIILLMGRQDELYKSISIFEVTDLIIPVFVACFIFAVAAKKQYKAVEEYSSPETGE